MSEKLREKLSPKRITQLKFSSRKSKNYIDYKLKREGRNKYIYNKVLTERRSMRNQLKGYHF